MSTSRRSAGTGGGTGSTPANTDEALSGQFVGVSDQQVEENPDQFFGELFRGAHFRKLKKPTAYRAGGVATISGVVHFDAPSVQLTSRGMRVRITSPNLEQDYTQRFRDIRHCNERSFSINIPVPDSPGSRFSYTVVAESTKLSGGWRDDSREGPFNVEIQGATGAAITRGFGYIPSAAIGAGIGLGVNRAAGLGYGRLASGGIGAAAGIFYNEYAPPISLGGLVPDVSNVQLGLLAAATFGSVLLLERSGASEILQPAGEAAGAALQGGVDAARSVAPDARRRLSSPR